MAYQTNPFLERMSERTTSDQEFVQLFSPKILERLPEDVFKGGVQIFHSPPGGGKTTLLRAFTPSALRAFWNARKAQDMNESFQRLVARQIMHEKEGPLMLGVLLSCASGYADLPPGATNAQDGLFRALLDCRVVLRSLRNLASLVDFGTVDLLDTIELDYSDLARELKSIPVNSTPKELMLWAEQRERSVYAELDTILGKSNTNMPIHVRFESVLWLQSVRFIYKGRVIYPKRLLMIDDLHKLRNKQRTLLIEELIEMRPTIPIWLAERSIALGEDILAQGSRQGRDIRHYSLEEMWSATKGIHQFSLFAQNILDRRLSVQNVLPTGFFSQYLRSTLELNDIREEVKKGIDKFQLDAQRHKSNTRYSEWLELAEQYTSNPSYESLLDLYVTRILLSRDEGKQQVSLELIPLSAEELNQRDSSQVQAAAEIFINDELKVPYYFGIDRICILASNNVEELLAIAASLFERLRAKQVLGKQALILSPHEQEKVVKEVAKQKRNFIPKNHTEGTRAQRLLDAIGSFCREKTFQPNAPIAPGVNGVRLSISELAKLHLKEQPLGKHVSTLRRVLAECVAENLLITKLSAASGSRESGNVFYLNRIFCAYFGLPVQYGGWQEVTVFDLIEWMEHGPTPKKKNLLEGN